jgi:general stress protein CsbA
MADALFCHYPCVLVSYTRILFSGISGIKLPVFLEQAQAGQEYSYSIAGHKGYQDQYGYDICGNN